jgi:plastocyanin
MDLKIDPKHIKIDPKHYTLIALIVVFFALGMILGYIVYTPTPAYEVAATPTATPPAGVITATPTATPTVKETTVTPVPTDTAPAVTPLKEPDFTAKSYDPEKDKPTKIIEFKNNRAQPDAVSIKPGNSVLFTITDYTVQSPITFILNSSYEKNLGKSGSVLVTFNNKGIYNFKAIMPSGDPNIIPREYATGTITVWTIS